MNMGKATNTQFSITFQIRSTVMEVYPQFMFMLRLKSTSSTMAKAVNNTDSPPRIHATGKPVNTSAMKLTNMRIASISLGAIGILEWVSVCEQKYPDPAEAGEHGHQQQSEAEG